LSTLFKIFERHIAKQMHSFFDKNNIIYNKQPGFRKNHSCNTALISLIDTWLNDVDSGNIFGTVFLDLKKAIDLVDHEILLHKLKLYHFSEVKLFKSYLSNRIQLVKIGNLQSQTMKIISDVLQGSILGPLLFLIYINDIAFISNDIKIDLFADDSTLYESGENISKVEVKLQDHLNNIEKWCKINNMALIPDKSKCMVIGTRQKSKYYEKIVS
jgi:hypothetical protein